MTDQQKEVGLRRALLLFGLVFTVTVAVYGLTQFQLVVCGARAILCMGSDHRHSSPDSSTDQVGS